MDYWLRGFIIIATLLILIGCWGWWVAEVETRLARLEKGAAREGKFGWRVLVNMLLMALMLLFGIALLRWLWPLLNA